MAPWLQIALILLPLVVPPLIAWLTVLVSHAMAKLPANERDITARVVRTSVAAVAQVASDQLNGPGKKQMAIELVQQQLAHYHISVPQPLIAALVEEAVKGLKIIENAPPAVLVPVIPEKPIQAMITVRPPAEGATEGRVA